MTAPATDGERLFLAQLVPAGERYRLTTLALDARDGTLVWTHDLPVDGPTDAEAINDFAAGTPAVAGSTVLVGAVTAVANEDLDPAAGLLLGLDARTGRERWRVPVGIVPRSVTVAGDRVYVSGVGGGLAALHRPEK